MTNEEYKKIVKKYTKNEDKLKNALMAFLSGGVIGIISVFIYQLFIIFNFSNEDATSIVLLVLIFSAALFTGMGFFDNLVEKFRCGLIIPITGFAHSISSEIVDTKKEGLVTGIGATAFKLAGSVILYGVISAFILVLIKVIFNV